MPSLLPALLILLLASARVEVPQTVPAQDGGDKGPGFSGEYLQYKVKWWIFRLGTIGMKTVLADDSAYGKVYLVDLTLESNPTLFFISVHSHFESVIQRSPVRCLQFRGYDYSGADTIFTHYWMVDSLHLVRMQQWNLKRNELLKDESIDSVDSFYEGTSLVYLARTLLHSNLRVTAPTMVDMSFFPTEINFTPRVVPVEIDAVDYPINGRELYGKANYVEKSLAGFSGAFRGWFSDDQAAIPIRAEMNLSLGTADVILEQWSRGTWSPPRFQDYEH